MTGKLLVVILSGDDLYKVQWGLRLALHAFTHPYGEQILDDVRVLLFGSGCTIVNPKMPNYIEAKSRIQALIQSGVQVASCISIVKQLDLTDETESLGISLVHASKYTALCVSQGYTIMTF